MEPWFAEMLDGLRVDAPRAANVVRCYAIVLGTPEERDEFAQRFTAAMLAPTTVDDQRWRTIFAGFDDQLRFSTIACVLNELYSSSGRAVKARRNA